MTDRDTVLGRIRAALTDVPADENPEYVPVPRDHSSHAGTDLIALFVERVTDYRAHVVEATTATAAEAVAGLLTAHGLRTLVVPPEFPEELLPQGSWQQLTEPLSVAELEAAEGVLTTCAVAIAVTGTLALDAGPGQGRRALTLLPDYHLCIVRADQIVDDVPDAIALLDPARPLTSSPAPPPPAT